MAKRQWVKVFHETGEHRVFKLVAPDDPHNGRLSVADLSGGTPDRTDDGPLWLPDRHGVLNVTRHGISTDVEQGADRNRVHVSPALAWWLQATRQYVLRVDGDFQISNNADGCAVVSKGVQP